MSQFPFPLPQAFRPISRRVRKPDHSLTLSRLDYEQDEVGVGISVTPGMLHVGVAGTERRLDVANVIWCTGFRTNFSWIDMPVFGSEECPVEPRHRRGIVHDTPGLYFVGLFFLYALTSSLLGGVGRDAKFVVDHITTRVG